MTCTFIRKTPFHVDHYSNKRQKDCLWKERTHYGPENGSLGFIEVSLKGGSLTQVSLYPDPQLLSNTGQCPCNLNLLE